MPLRLWRPEDLGRDITEVRLSFAVLTACENCVEFSSKSLAFAFNHTQELTHMLSFPRGKRGPKRAEPKPWWPAPPMASKRCRDESARD